MEIRTTTLGTTNSMLNYITGAESRYYELAQEASSGSKLTEPSDNPTAAKSVLNINTKLSQITSYLNNMSTAQNELNILDGAFASATKAVQSATDLTTQAANGTYSNEDLVTIKQQIDQIISGIVDIGNTQYNGVYMFSGTATTTPAYAVDNVTGSITYKGIPSTGEYQRYTQISDGVSVPINTTADQVFGSWDGATNTGTGLIGTLKTLSNALATADRTTISSSLGSLATNGDTVLVNRTQMASISKRFDMTQSSLETTQTQLKAYKSDLSDADLAEVLTDLAAQKLALQATMSVTSNLLSGASLLDYIK